MCEGRRARGEAGRGNDARRPDFSAFEDSDHRRDTRDGHEAGGADAVRRRDPVVVACDGCFNAFDSGNHDNSGRRRTDPANVAGSDDRTGHPVDVVGSDDRTGHPVDVVGSDDHTNRPVNVVGSSRHAGVRVFP